MGGVYDACNNIRHVICMHKSEPVSLIAGISRRYSSQRDHFRLRLAHCAHSAQHQWFQLICELHWTAVVVLYLVVCRLMIRQLVERNARTQQQMAVVERRPLRSK